MYRTLEEDDDGVTEKQYSLQKKPNCTETQKVKGELGVVYKATDHGDSMLVTVAARAA